MYLWRRKRLGAHAVPAMSPVARGGAWGNARRDLRRAPSRAWVGCNGPSRSARAYPWARVCCTPLKSGVAVLALLSAWRAASQSEPEPYRMRSPRRTRAPPIGPQGLLAAAGSVSQPRPWPEGVSLAALEPVPPKGRRVCRVRGAECPAGNAGVVGS